MPQSYQEHNGDNSTHTYTIAFGSGTTKYLKREHIKLYYGRDRVAGTQTNTLTLDTDYVYISDFVIKLIGSTLNTGVTVGDPYPLASGRKLTIERDTPQDSLLVPWADGSQLTKEALETSNLQVLFGQQEEADSGLLNSTEARAATTASNTATANVATLTANPIFSGNFGSTSIDLDDNAQIKLGTGDDASIYWDGTGHEVAHQLKITSAGPMELSTGSNKNIQFAPSGTVEAYISSSAFTSYVNVVPNADGTLDLGATNVRWANAYVNTANVNDITGGAVITTGTSTSDTKVYSAKRCDELYYNLASAEEIQSGEAWVAADNKVATTAAIDARIVDLVDDVGGFVPIANETSFPNANPDVNNGAGTLVSVPLVNNLTSTPAGLISINNGTVGNSTVTIVGAGLNTTYTAGFGIIVETTTTLNTYHFHRYVPKATEVTTVATNIANINAAVSNQTNINSAVSNATNINAVATNISNVNTVAGISADVTAVVGDAADIGACSTNIGSIAAIGSDLANNFENITDYGSITGAVTSTSGTSDISTLASGSNLTNIATVSGISANVTTVAGISANVTAVANDATDIGTCASNISAITGAPTQATNAAASATAAASSQTAATASQAAAAYSATAAANYSTEAALSATTSTAQAAIATTQATNSAASASTANTHQLTAKQWRDDASGIKTQAESNVYNLSDSVSSHTAWGNVTDVGTTHFSSESGNILLTMTKGSSVYDYGAVA